MKTRTKNATGEEVAVGYYTAIDYHRRYSIVLTQDPAGRQVRTARITGNAPAAFAEYFKSLGGPSAVVIEACWNWEWLYEVIEKIPAVHGIVVADPLKTRLIAEAQVKSDKVDARALATLLRAGLICRIHVPSRRTRARKALLRQRMFWVRQRTRIRNRRAGGGDKGGRSMGEPVHTLLARQHGLELPARRDLFGAGGMRFLRALRLHGHDGLLLGQDLAMLDALEVQVAEAEARAAREFKADKSATRLQSLPGVGPLLWRCNKWLRWALIEAAWGAIRHSPYFATLHGRHCARGKNTNTAAVILRLRSGPPAGWRRSPFCCSKKNAPTMNR